MAAAIRLSQQHSCSLDHLVGGSLQGQRNRQAQRLRGLEVDDELELGRLLDRKVGWLRTLEHTINIRGCPTIHLGIIRAIPDQCTISSCRRPRHYRRQTETSRGIDEPLSVTVHKWAGLNDECYGTTRLH